MSLRRKLSGLLAPLVLHRLPWMISRNAPEKMDRTQAGGTQEPKETSRKCQRAPRSASLARIYFIQDGQLEDVKKSAAVGCHPRL